MVEDMDVDLDKEFLQDLKDLKILITDKDLLDQHKRYEFTAGCEFVWGMGIERNECMIPKKSESCILTPINI